MLHDIEAAQVGDISEVIVDSYDVMAALGELGCHLDFSLEADFELGLILKELLVDDLDHAFSLAQLQVARQKNGAEASLSQLLNEAVLSCDHHERKAALEAKVSLLGRLFVFAVWAAFRMFHFTKNLAPNNSTAHHVA